MKKIFSISLVFLLAFLFPSCEFAGEETRLWFFTHSTGNADNQPLKPSHFLYLMQDGTYTSDFGTFEHGKWERTEKEIVLTNNIRRITTLTVALKTRNLMQVKMKDVLLNFESLPTIFQDNMDPFSLKNNQWRIPATERETMVQIRDRLINHCSFWEAYFLWGDDNNLTTLDVRSTPTPIKIYGNGIGLKSYADLPAAWCNYFADTTDCYKATDILRDVFRKNNIAWPKTENKYKMFLSAFRQVKQHLKEADVE